jgi:hypothetical protein
VNGAGEYRGLVDEEEAFLRFVEAVEGVIAEEQQIYWSRRGGEPPSGPGTASKEQAAGGEKKAERDRAYEDQQHRARGLNLLVAAFVLWNTRYLGEAVDVLRRHGHTLPEEILAHVWPLAWDHINLTGDYSWGSDTPPVTGQLRDLRLDTAASSIPLQQAA